MKELTQEEADALMKKWFEEFEVQDKLHESQLARQEIKPDFDFQKNKYLYNYAAYCPAFRELLNTDSPYAIKTLWEFKNFKRKLVRGEIQLLNTYNRCITCKGICGRKACELRVIKPNTIVYSKEEKKNILIESSLKYHNLNVSDFPKDISGNSRERYAIAFVVREAILLSLSIEDEINERKIIWKDCPFGTYWGERIPKKLRK